MSNLWENAVMTNKGENLQTKIFAGAAVNIDAVKVGTGTVPAAQVLLSNDTVNDAYDLRQIGFYATDPDEGTILYAIAQSSKEKHVPSKTEAPGFSMQWNFYFTFSDAVNMTVTIDPARLSSVGFVESVPSELQTEIKQVAKRATKVSASETNGNIVIDGKEAVIYVHPGSGTNPHRTTKADVGLGNVPNVATNDQTPTYTMPPAAAYITSGEKLSTSMGKILRAIADLISHMANKTNPHAVTKAQVGLGNVDNTADRVKKVDYAASAGAAQRVSQLSENFKDGTALPSAYPSGISIFFSNLPQNKFNTWDYRTVETHKGYSNMVCTQFIYQYNQGTDAPIYYRQASYNTDKWGAWKQIITKDTLPASLPANGGNAATVNGHSVNADVPAGAKFTDTVYTHPSTHPASMITGLPTSLPANGGTSAYANYLNANNLAAGTDLNSITVPGFYFCPANSTVASFKNCPTDNAFFLLVGKHAGSHQMLTEYTTGNFRIFVRNLYAGSWGSWKKILTSDHADGIIQHFNAAIGTAWSGSTPPYTQTISIPGVLATDTPIVDCVLSSVTATALLQEKAWNCVSRITTAANSITVICNKKKPVTAIPIQIKAVR